MINTQKASSWKGRFPENDIISLLKVNRRFNLAESTAQDFSFHEIIDLVGYETVRDLRLGYGADQGLEQLRKGVAALCQLPDDNILSTTGTALALYLLAIELCRPGDDVIIFTPCFPPSRDALLGSGLNVKEIPLLFDERYKVNLSRFEKALSPRTKLVSLATPQNPSGIITSHETIQAMLDIMDRIAPDAWLFIDETYLHATYGDNQAPKSAAMMHPKVMTGASISKSLGAPGLRVGWITVRDPELLQRLLVAKMNIVLSGSPLDETLAAHLILKRDDVLKPRSEMLKTALETLEIWQKRNSDLIAYIRPDGGAMCCMKLRETVFDNAGVEKFWASLESHDLQLASGTWFGESDRIFRLGFGYLPIEEFKAALSKLEKVLRTGYK